MAEEKRFGLSAVHEIERVFGKGHSSIRCVVSHHGGFVPAVRESLQSPDESKNSQLDADGVPVLLLRCSLWPAARVITVAVASGRVWC